MSNLARILYSSNRICLRAGFANFRIVNSEDGGNIEKRYERLMGIFSEKEDELFREWAKTVPSTVDIGLNRNILSRDNDSAVLLNFDPELLGVLKEVNYLKQMSLSDIPEEAIKVPCSVIFIGNLCRTVHVHPGVRERGDLP